MIGTPEHPKFYSFHSFKYFYPWSPKVEPWVNRWTFSPPPSPPSPSHHQIVVSLRYRKCQFSNWFDFPGNSSDSYLFLLLLLLFPGVFLYCTVLYCVYCMYCTAPPPSPSLQKFRETCCQSEVQLLSEHCSQHAYLYSPLLSVSP